MPKVKIEPYITIEQLSEHLNVPKKSLYKWCSESNINGFPYYRIGVHSRFKISEVDNWIKKYGGSIGTKS